MPDEAVYHQASFLSGEWSPLAQGRSDLDAYKTALNVCLNAYPSIEGSFVRRSGTRYIGPTIDRTYSKLLPFSARGGYRLVLECGDQKLRILSGATWLTTNDDQTIIGSSSVTGALTVTLDNDHGWAVGDMVLIEPVSGVNPEAGLYFNRLMRVQSVPTTSSLTLHDDEGDTFGFDSLADVMVDCIIKRVRQFTTDWEADVLPDLRIVQASDEAIILTRTVHPKSLPILNVDGVITFGSLADLALEDGPYLDNQIGASGGNETGAVSAYTGSITFTPASTTFTAVDVGRLIRLYHEPAAWNNATTYTYGQAVTYEGQWWRSIATGDYASDNVNVIPGTLASIDGSSVTLWAPAPEAGRWAWGTITAQAGTSCTVSLETNLNSANGTTITEWRLGVYTTDQYPTCGTYHNGRLYLAGAVPNRIDVSKANDKTNFSTTDEYGNVDDDHAVVLELNFDDQQSVCWLASDEKGVIAGTEGGEVLITSASGLTPYDREAAKMTRYLCSNIEPCRAGSAILFVQFYRRYIVEYRPSPIGTRFVGTYINEFSKHLTVNALKEIAYQQMLTPTVWCLSDFGDLTGITYRRNENEIVAGSHRHEIANNGRYVASICVGSHALWTNDLLYMCTYEVSGGASSIPDNGSDFAIEILQPVIPDR
ncbi:MAG: hypothetical protein AB7H90_03490 [Alphaproteobacteria bacterium]